MTSEELSLYIQLPGRMADFFPAGNTVDLPAGKEYGVAPPNGYQDSVYLNGGCDYVNVKENINVNDYANQFGTPVSKQLRFTSNPQPFQAFRPNKTIVNWDESDCRDFVDWEYGRNGGFCGIWIWATESYDDSFPWRPDPGEFPQQVAWLEYYISLKNASTGHKFLGDYGGLIDLQTFLAYNHREAELIPVLLGGTSAALAWMKVNEAPWSKYFAVERWRLRHTLVDTYRLTKYWTDYSFMFKVMVTMQLCRMAMDADEVTIKRKIYTYYMPSGWQFVVEGDGYTEIYPRSPVTGGTIQSQQFVKMTYTSRVFQACIEFFWADGRLQWSDGFRHGTSLDVIPNNAVNFIPNGQPFRQADVPYTYRNGDVGCSGDFFGNHNADEDGANWYSLMVQHTGTQNWNFVSYRNNGTSDAFFTVDNAYLIRRFQANEVFAFDMVGTGAFAGKAAVVGFTPPGAWRVLDFKLSNGTTYTRIDPTTNQPQLLAPNEPFCFLINL